MVATVSVREMISILQTHAFILLDNESLKTNWKG